MSRSTRLVRAGLLTAAGTLLISGCGGGGDTGSASSSSAAGTTSSSSAESSAEEPVPSATPDAASFCAQAEPVFTDLNAAFEAAGTDGVAALPPLLDQAVASFDAVQPPADIAPDWQTVRGGFAQLRDQVAAIDPAAPDAATQVDGAVAAVEGSEAGPALERLGTYYDQHCAAGAAPTS